MPGRLVVSRAARTGSATTRSSLPDDGNELTNGELAPQEKDAISHRGKALRSLAAQLGNAVFANR